jgi:hypothetical protein
MKWKKLKNKSMKKKMEKKLTFDAWKLGVIAPTCTWQEGEWKYHTKETRTIVTQEE